MAQPPGSTLCTTSESGGPLNQEKRRGGLSLTHSRLQRIREDMTLVFRNQKLEVAVGPTNWLQLPVVFFKCFITPPNGGPPRLVELAFIEEFWRYTTAAAHSDRLDQCHGCTLSVQNDARAYILCCRREHHYGARCDYQRPGAHAHPTWQSGGQGRQQSSCTGKWAKLPGW